MGFKFGIINFSYPNILLNFINKYEYSINLIYLD